MSNVLVRNAADPKQVKHAADQTRRGREQRIQDVRAIMSTPGGRRVMRSIVVDMCGIYRPGSEPGRDTGLNLLADLREVCPVEWELAEREHREQMKNSQRPNEASDND